MLDPNVIWGAMAAAISALFGTLMAVIWNYVSYLREQNEAMRNRLLTAQETLLAKVERVERAVIKESR